MTVLSDVLQKFIKEYDLNCIEGLLDKKGGEFTGLAGSSKALFIAAFFQHLKRGIVLVTKSNRDASDLYGDLSLFIKDPDIYLFPSRETLPYDDARPFTEIVIKRILALHAFTKKKNAVFVLPVRTFTDFFITKEVFESSCFQLARGDEVPFSELENKLIQNGYEREDRVSSMGCFALRGDILDIFVYGNEHPFRVEFFDDTVDSIREFSYITQRSVQEVDEITILPAKEVVITPEINRELEKKKDRYNEEIIEKIRDFGSFQGIEDYVAIIHDDPGTVLDYAGGEYIIIFDSFTDCLKQARFFKKETERLYLEKKDKFFLLPPEMMSAEFSDLVADPPAFGSISILPESDNNVFDFGISEKKGYRGQIKQFKSDIEEFLIDGYMVIVGASYEGQTNRVRELLEDLMKDYEDLLVMTLDMHEGFLSHRMKLLVVLDREIFSRKKRYKRQFLEVKSAPFTGMLDIKNGDYIVHVDHGIGYYRGIEKLSTGGVEKDFIKIEYRDGDEIFIPVDQINRVQKYIGHEGRIPRIDRLGTDTWKKVKAHVKKSVKNLAKELIELYSIRASQIGYSFSKDTEWQYEFESGFRYEETPDQIRTLEELKRDMEDPRPMDRLVCGDVGFGKTEIAIRAAFKAVMDGKQVAVLVPTTILAEQHLGTFADRFSLYPVKVDMLSRFKTHREQKEIIENLKKGTIDVVIGTHRLIQKDIMFKDLGLVIVDEEQRFGVEHKERLKQLRKMVDVITMTATPIPRTLYMSMTKIRDMSVIETPPRDRMPIETFVLEYNEEIIIQAIRREIERGGQVYYVHNRVRTIEEKAESLKRILPGVTIEIAHGRMDERDLEEIMKDFFDMEFQVLVTTTIIESGLDIPNVNTIIMERADRFGLSQLYQLRGRVGRSKRKAYAYLFYPTGKSMTEQAQKRLMVINDHTELGAGYSIAMKDLEIRGAGNILGRDQHGDMLTVGFEMYVKLLDEAIQELRRGPAGGPATGTGAPGSGTAAPPGAGQRFNGSHPGRQARDVLQDTTVGPDGLPPAEEAHGDIQSPAVSPVVDVKYSGFIPKTYIESEKLRIEVYRRLSGVRTTYELNELKDELNDRFGLLPNELLELFYFAGLKVLCIIVGIKSLREKEDELVLVFEKSRVDILQLIRKINKNRKLFGISPRDHNTLHVYRTFEDNILKLDFLKDLFDYEEDT